MKDNSIWNLLSQVDVNAHTEDKGGFTYLSWTWAWAEVKKRYADATYSVLEDVVYDDGTREVRCEVKIDELRHVMWLPVTDHRNKAIPKPDAFAVNTARMRCLVKCLAMFGLGHYIYAGESLPPEPSLDDETRSELLSYMGENGDFEKFAHLYRAQSEEHLKAFYDGFSQGHKTKTKQRVRDLLAEYQRMVESYVSGIQQGIGHDDAVAIHELVAEIDEQTKRDVWQLLNDFEKEKVKQLMKEVA